MAKSTKPKSATSYRDTAFGILPRSKVVHLEKEGVKKALEYITKLIEEKTEITPQLIRDIHKVGFGIIFPGNRSDLRTQKLLFEAESRELNALKTSLRQLTDRRIRIVSEV